MVSYNKKKRLSESNRVVMESVLWSIQIHVWKLISTLDYRFLWDMNN